MVAASRVKTNWLLLDDLEFWDEFTTKAITDPDTEDYFKQIDQAIDDKLAETIKWLDSDEAKEYFQQEAEYQEEIFEALEEEWDNILSGEISSVDELLDRIYEHGKQKGYTDIRERIHYTDADRQALQFAKDYNFQLIQKLDDNLRDAIKNRVIQAVASGEHPYELASKIQELGVQPLPGSTLSARHRAVMIARTETARVQNTGIIQSYVNEGFTEVNILTAEDSSVCRLCLANAYEFNTDEIVLENRGADRTHKIADMNSNSWVPLHPNCRCTYVAVWDSRGEAPEEPEPVNLTPPKEKEYTGSTRTEKTWGHSEETFNVRNYGDVEIALGENVKYTNFQEIKQIYDNLPDALKKDLQTIRISAHYPKDNTVGYFMSGTPTITLYNHSGVNQTIKHTLTHEATHLWEEFSYQGKYGLSNSEKYRNAFKEDNKLYQKPRMIDGEPVRDKRGRIKYRNVKKLVSDYAIESYKKFHRRKERRNRELSEDLAESVPQYLYDHDNFAEKFPNRAKLIEQELFK